MFEYVDRTLLEVLEASPGGLDAEAVRAFIFQLVRALEYAHRHGVVHRDVKPENLLIGPPGARGD